MRLLRRMILERRSERIGTESSYWSWLGRKMAKIVSYFGAHCPKKAVENFSWLEPISKF